MEGYQSSHSWPQECPFSDVGCTVSLHSTLEYQAHLSKNTERHLQMIADLHHQTITGEPRKGKVILKDIDRQEQIRDDHKPEEIQDQESSNSEDKLKAIISEVEFLTDVLSGYGIRQLPALECIKTQLKMPDVGIMTFGDSCSFRMVNMSHHRETGRKWLSPHFFVRGGHKMCLAVYPSGLGSGEGTHMSLKLLLLFDDQLEWPISLPSHLGIRVELMIESEGLFEEDDSAFGDNPLTATHALPSNHHHLECTWKPRGERKSSSSSSSPKSVVQKSFSVSDKRYSLNRKIPPSSLVRRASFNERSLRKPASSEENQQRLSRILPPWCQQPPQPQISTISETNGGDQIKSDLNGTRQVDVNLYSSKTRTNDRDFVSTLATSSSRAEERKNSSRKESKLEIKQGQNELFISGDFVDGATVFCMEKFATHDQIEKYTQEYNSLVFQITLCLV